MNYFEPADISIYIQGRGVIWKDKSLVAAEASSGKIKAYGKEAEAMAASQAETIQIFSPFRRGAPADYMALVPLFAHLLQMAWGKRILCKPSVAICAPKHITPVEKKVLEEVMYQAGAREVFVSDATLEQIVEESYPLPSNWKKVKTFIGIGKDEPERYIAEQISSLLEYAGHEGISSSKVAKILQEIAESR